MKQKLKDLLRNVDSDKSGKIKDSVFYTILQLHGVDLTKKEQQALNVRFASGGNIKYKEALAEIQIDLVAAMNNEIKWVVT